MPTLFTRALILTTAVIFAAGFVSRPALAADAATQPAKAAAPAKPRGPLPALEPLQPLTFDLVNFDAAVRKIDIDRNGRPYLVLPDNLGGLTVITPNGAATSRVHLEGMRRDDFPACITSLDAAEVRGQTCWVVAYQVAQPDGWLKAVIEMFDGGGLKLWSHEETQQRADCAAIAAIGDADGDGQNDILVGINSTTRIAIEDNVSNAPPRGVSVLVLAADGTIRTSYQLEGKVSSILAVEAVRTSKESRVPTIICVTPEKAFRFRFRPPEAPKPDATTAPSH